MDNSENAHVCSICQATFAGEDNLQVHLLLHASENPYGCEIYNTDQENLVYRESSNELEEHGKRQAGENVYTHGIYNDMLTQKNDLDALLMMHAYENSHNNKIRSTTFATDESLNEDLTVKKSHTCHVCQKSFAWKGDLNRYLRVHTGKKPFVCGTCGTAFTLKGNLKEHNRLHTGEKPYVCAACGKAFTNKGNLNKHFRLHTGEKAYVCATCGKAFAQKRTWNEHFRLHTGEKPFVCTTCGKAFTHKGTFNKHNRLHTGETPNACSASGKALAQQNDIE